MNQTLFSKKTLASNQNKEEKLWESESHSTEVEISNLDLTTPSSTEEIQISIKMRDASRVTKENIVYITVVQWICKSKTYSLVFISNRVIAECCWSNCLPIVDGPFLN